MTKIRNLTKLLIAFDKEISWPEKQVTIDHALTFIFESFDVESVTLTTHDQDTGALDIQSRGRTVTLLNKLRSQLPDILTLRARNPIYRKDLNLLPHPNRLEKQLIDLNFRSLYRLPLLIEDLLIGELYLTHKKPDAIEPQSRELLTLLSTRLALALYHAGLHDNLKEKEQALRKSEANYRDLIDQAGDIIIKGAPNGDIIQVNQSAVNLLGYSSSDFLTMNIAQLFSPEVLESKPLRFDLLSKGDPIVIERPVLCKDGSSLLVEMNSRQLEDGSFVSIFRDLSESKRVVDQLKDSEARMRALLDTLPLPVFARDIAGKYTLLNEAYLAFFGRKAEDMLGKRVQDCWPDDVAASFIEDDNLLLKKNKRQSYPLQVENSDGEMRQVIVNKARYTDANDNVAGFIGTMWDFTDLSAAENRYQKLFELSPDPIVVHDGAYLMMVNQAAMDFFGSDDLQKYMTQPVTEFLHPDSREESANRIQRLFKGEKQSQPSRQKFITASGETRMVEAIATLIEYAGQPAVMTSFRDITEQNKYIELLENSEENFRNLFDSNPNPTVVHTDAVFTYANKAALEFAGAQNMEEYLGRSVFDFVHKDYVPLAMENYYLVNVERKMSERGEQKYLRINGEARDVEAKAVPIFFMGKPSVMVSFRDVTEEKLTRQQLQDSEERYLKSFQHSPTAMLLHDNGRLVDANNAALSFVGAKDMDDLTSLDIYRFVHPDYREETRKRTEKLVVENRAGTLKEMLFLTLSGEERWVEVVGVPVIHSGHPLVLVSFNDITEKFIARKQLEDSQAQLELITDHVTHFIVLLDLDLRLLYGNRAFAEWAHVDKSLLPDKPLTAFVNEAVHKTLKNCFDLVLETGEIQQQEYEYVPKKGKGNKQIFLSTMIPVTGKQKELIAVLMQTQDVTESRQTQHELSENRALLELVIDTLPGLFSYSDRNETFLYVNQAYADWHNKARNEIIGSSINDLLDTKHYRSVEARFRDVLNGHPQHFNIVSKRNSADERHFDVRYIPYFDDQQTVQGFLTSLTDITEQNRAQLLQKSLYDIASTLTRDISLHDVGKVSAHTIRNLFNSDALAIELYDHEKQLVLGLYSEDTLDGESTPKEVPTRNLPFSHYSNHWFAPDFKPLCVNRADETAKPLETLPFGSPRKSLSILYIPLLWESRVIGMVSVHSYTRDKYSEHDIPVLESLVNQIAGALVRSQGEMKLKEQKQTLEVEERKYRSFIENAGDAVFVLALGGQILAVNENACTSVDYTEEELLELNLRVINPQFFRILNRKMLASLKLDRKSYTLEGEHTRKDGFVFPVELRVSITEVDQKQTLLCFARDITERKLVELQETAVRKLARSLNDAKEFSAVGRTAGLAIRSYFESDALAIEYYDFDTKMILGIYTEDTFRNEKEPQAIPPTDTPFSKVSKTFFTKNSVPHVRNRSQKELRELKNNRPFGSGRFSHSLLFAPIVWEGKDIGVLTIQSYADNKYSEKDLPTVQFFADQIGGALVRTINTMELQKKRHELEESETKYRSIIENAGDALLLTSLNGDILAVNNSAVESLGYTEAELMNTNLKSINHWFGNEMSKKQLVEFARLKSSKTIETRHTNKNGQTIPVELRVATMELDGETCLLYFARDITERKESETFRDALREMARQLTVTLGARDLGKVVSSILRDYYAYDAFILYEIDQTNFLAKALYAEDVLDNSQKPGEVEVDSSDLAVENIKKSLVLSKPRLLNREKIEEHSDLVAFGNVARRSMSLVYVPIFWEKQQIGLFTIQSYTQDFYQPDDLPKLKIFADQIGGAMSRTQADGLLRAHTEALQDREKQLETSIREKEVLLREVYHRVKNNMQVIIGLLEMQGHKAKSDRTRVVVMEMIDRITSMSLVHDLLYRSKSLAEIHLDKYLERLVERLIVAYQTSSGEISLNLDAEAVPVNIQLAVPLGLVINEIVTNTLKYAFPDNQEGQLSIKARLVGDDGLELIIMDDGKGLPDGFDLSKTQSLGMRIIHDIVELQLFGKITIQSHPGKGVEYRIDVPQLNF